MSEIKSQTLGQILRLGNKEGTRSASDISSIPFVKQE